MRSKWLLVCCALLALVFAASGCGPSGTAEKGASSSVPEGYRTLRIVGSTIGSGSTTAAMGLTKVLNEFYPEIEWSSCSGATSLNPAYIAKGTVKLAVFLPMSVVDALGADKVPESRSRSIGRVNAVLNYVFLILADKPWKDITEVPKRLTLCPGPPATTVPAACEAWLNVSGLSKSDFKWVPMGKQEMADAWRAGKIDFAFSNIDSPAPFVLDMATSPRKFKPLGLSESQLEKARSERAFEKLGFLTPQMGNLTEIVPE